MMKSSPAKSFLVFALLLICALQLVAQTDTGRIEGIVTDNTGGILPGATVTARNTGTNATRVDVTNSTGAYTLTALPVGNYRVQVDLSGFKTQVTPITLTVNWSAEFSANGGGFQGIPDVIHTFQGRHQVRQIQSIVTH